MKSKNNDIAVIGLGTFGFALAVNLEKQGNNVMAIDIDMEKINHIKNQVSVAIQADVTDEDVLKKIDIQHFDKVIFGMSHALESIILSITLMKKLQVPYIIAKANTQIQREVLLKIGVDEVVLPEIATATRLAERLTHPNILEKFELHTNQSLMEVVVPKKFHKKTLKELELRKKYGINVIMKKKNDETDLITDADTYLYYNDILFVVGNEKNILKIFVD